MAEDIGLDYEYLSEDAGEGDVNPGTGYYGLVEKIENYGVFVRLNDFPREALAQEMASGSFGRGRSSDDQLGDAPHVLVHHSNLGDLSPSDLTPGDAVIIHVTGRNDEGKLRGALAVVVDATRQQHNGLRGPAFDDLEPTYATDEDAAAPPADDRVAGVLDADDRAIRGPASDELKAALDTTMTDDTNTTEATDTDIAGEIDRIEELVQMRNKQTRELKNRIDALENARDARPEIDDLPYEFKFAIRNIRDLAADGHSIETFDIEMGSEGVRIVIETDAESNP